MPPAAPAAGRSGADRLGADLARTAARVLRDHRWFIGIVLVQLAIGFAVTRYYGQAFSLEIYNGIHATFFLNFAAAFVIFRVVRMLVRHRPERPLSFLWDDLRASYLAPARLLNALPALLLLPLVLSVTTSLKRLIPAMNPFQWDVPLAEIDAALHGGYQPWELLQPLLGHPWVTSFLSQAYSVPWFALILFMQFWQTFTLDPQRMRFLLSYVLCWGLLGNGLATMLSSVGPCYYGYIVDGPNPFAPLMAYLNSAAETVPLPSLMAQGYLWETYQNNDLSVGAGISAMPSLHIAMATLLFLLSLRRHWSLRAAAAGYIAILLVGSVHLGWHYAIDGYLAIAAAATIWWAVGRALKWQDERPHGAARNTRQKLPIS
jgi:hypothetical protein